MSYLEQLLEEIYAFLDCFKPGKVPISQQREHKNDIIRIIGMTSITIKGMQWFLGSSERGLEKKCTVIPFSFGCTETFTILRAT